MPKKVPRTLKNGPNISQTFLKIYLLKKKQKTFHHRT